MLRRIGAQRDILGESPVWAVDEQGHRSIDLVGHLDPGLVPEVVLWDVLPVVELRVGPG